MLVEHPLVVEFTLTIIPGFDVFGHDLVNLPQLFMLFSLHLLLVELDKKSVFNIFSQFPMEVVLPISKLPTLDVLNAKGSH